MISALAREFGEMQGAAGDRVSGEPGRDGFEVDAGGGEGG